MSTENDAKTRICDFCKNPYVPSADQRQSGGGKVCSYRCAAKKPRRPLAERFWKKVQKSEGCWLWGGALNSYGYGTITRAGGAKVMATHVAWELAFGPIIGGLCVLHRCDNPPCVRPDHLFLGTKGDNNTDRAKKDRNRNQSGERNEMAILTEDQVRDIRTRHAAGGITQRSLAKEFGVCFQAINDILRRKSWKHVA